MAWYKQIDTSPRFLAVDLERQLISGSFVHALRHLIERDLDLSKFDARCANDRAGAAAYLPTVLLKVVLYAYSLGIVSSRRIERACREQVTLRQRMSRPAIGIAPFHRSQNSGLRSASLAVNPGAVARLSGSGIRGTCALAL